MKVGRPHCVVSDGLWNIVFSDLRDVRSYSRLHPSPLSVSILGFCDIPLGRGGEAFSLKIN